MRIGGDSDECRAAFLPPFNQPRFVPSSPSLTSGVTPHSARLRGRSKRQRAVPRPVGFSGKGPGQFDWNFLSPADSDLTWRL